MTEERAHALLSASSAHRWLECPPSAVAAEAYPGQDTEFTREGTLAHAVAEIKAHGGDATLEKARATGKYDITQEMVDCAEEYANYIEELKASNNAVVMLERKVDFSPWVPQGFGTCDCIVLDGDKLTIIDYKYGAGVKVSAQDNPQMKLYALGALNDYGFVYDVKNIELHIFQPRMNNISTYALTTKELLEWADNTVKPIAEKAAKGEGEYKVGEHCRFCPHAGKCRTLTETCTLKVKLHGMQDGEYAKVPTLAPHEIAEVLRLEPIISLWLKRVKDQAMTTLLDGGEVPGYKVVEGRGSRAWSNEIEVSTILIDNGYSLEDISKTELLSVAAMEKAIGKKKVAELLSTRIEKKSGAPSLVVATDKRPAYDRKAEAVKDFTD